MPAIMNLEAQISFQTDKAWRFGIRGECTRKKR
jgi:hypothetical protein